MKIYNRFLSKVSIANQLIFFLVFGLSSSDSDQFRKNEKVDNIENGNKIIALFKNNQNIKIDNTAVTLAHADWIATSWQEYMKVLDKNGHYYTEFNKLTEDFIKKVNHKIQSLINEINKTVTTRTKYINEWQKDYEKLVKGKFKHSNELERLSLKMSGSELDPISRAFESKSRFSLVQQELYQQVTKLQELYCYVCVYNIIYEKGDISNTHSLMQLQTNLKALQSAFGNARINEFSKNRFKNRVKLCIKKLNRVIKLTQVTLPSAESSIIPANLNEEDMDHSIRIYSSHFKNEGYA